jgi:hypothetical protein
LESNTRHQQFSITAVDIMGQRQATPQQATATAESFSFWSCRTAIALLQEELHVYVAAKY